MVFSIEIRKIQKTGGSSYIVSLPIDWIKSHNIDKNYKGYSLGILTQPDGNLLITPNPNTEEIERVKEFDIDDVKDYDFLFRILIGAYIMGYSKILVKSSRKFDPILRDCITNFTKIAIGPEIIEESNQNITIKDLLNPKEMPFNKTIRRMYILADSMHEDAITALITGDRDLAEEVIKRDNEVDRLHWLIGRQSNIAMKDIILCQKMGVTLEDASQYQFFSKFLERIGDHSVNIAKNTLKIIGFKIDKKIFEKIVEASEIARKKLLTKSLDAWLQKDIHLANQIIESVKELISACEEITLEPNQTNVEISIAISYIIESIRRTGEYAGDICEVIINNLIKE